MTLLRTRITDRLATLRGWRGKLACFIAGALTTFGFAPYHVFPVVFLTLPFLFLMLEKARHPRSAALYAWAFGYGYTMAGTYWIANALLVDAEQFGWLVPFCVLGLSLLFSVWFALFGALVRWTQTPNLAINILRFALLWVAVEYWRSFGMFGFPWNLLGSMALADIHIAQLASVIGSFGLSLFVLLIALAPLWWLKQFPQRRYALLATLAAVVFVYAYGLWRLPGEVAMSNTEVRLVQGNIAQSMKWTERGRMESAAVYGALSRIKNGDQPVPPVILWPETALPFTLHEGDIWPAQLAPMIPRGGALITGAVRSTGEGSGYKLYNSIATIDADGAWHASYDKHQLVPFGEFVPLRSVLPIEKITPGGIDFSRGTGAATVSIGAIPPFSPLVCYEVIFPWLAADRAHRPDWIFNATNDAWYGDTPGPYQHFAAARLRAIEQGLPLARAANTGISAVIDPYGRTLQLLPLNRRGIIDQLLPRPLQPTLYSHFGELITLTILLMGWFATQWWFFRAKK
jgi:apolipoprotein N-acyltransferase